MDSINNELCQLVISMMITYKVHNDMTLDKVK